MSDIYFLIVVSVGFGLALGLSFQFVERAVYRWYYNRNQTKDELVNDLTKWGLHRIYKEGRK